MKEFAMGQFSKKISLLMRALDKNQTEISEKARLSRVSLNRFLRGQSELRLSDFIQMLRILGIDLEKVIQDRMTEVTDEKAHRKKSLGADMEMVVSSMGYLAKQSYIGHLVAYAEMLGSIVPKTVQGRLMSELNEIREAVAAQAREATQQQQ